MISPSLDLALWQHLDVGPGLCNDSSCLGESFQCTPLSDSHVRVAQVWSDATPVAMLQQVAHLSHLAAEVEGQPVLVVPRGVPVASTIQPR